MKHFLRSYHVASPLEPPLKQILREAIVSGRVTTLPGLVVAIIEILGINEQPLIAPSSDVDVEQFRLDVAVRGKNGITCRPWITLAVSAETGAALAVCAGVDPATFGDVARMLEPCLRVTQVAVAQMPLRSDAGLHLEAA